MMRTTAIWNKITPNVQEAKGLSHTKTKSVGMLLKKLFLELQYEYLCLGKTSAPSHPKQLKRTNINIESVMFH